MYFYTFLVTGVPVCLDPPSEEEEPENTEMKLIWEEREHAGGWQGSHWRQTEDHRQHMFQESYTWCESIILLHMFIIFLGLNGTATQGRVMHL